jgi:hypothetical protein
MAAMNGYQKGFRIVKESFADLSQRCLKWQGVAMRTIPAIHLSARPRLAAHVASG